ncbi:unnamed protein product [Linum trigynum]|uniref:Uncharacterized protein n=1 Tax=Linum trigynum TaxID=586398 RepID=A0AAV2F8N2_9ROSI
MEGMELRATDQATQLAQMHEILRRLDASRNHDDVLVARVWPSDRGMLPLPNQGRLVAEPATQLQAPQGLAREIQVEEQENLPPP